MECLARYRTGTSRHSCTRLLLRKLTHGERPWSGQISEPARVIRMRPYGRLLSELPNKRLPRSPPNRRLGTSCQIQNVARAGRPIMNLIQNEFFNRQIIAIVVNNSTAAVIHTDNYACCTLRSDSRLRRLLGTAFLLYLHLLLLLLLLRRRRRRRRRLLFVFLVLLPVMPVILLPLVC